MTRNGLLILIAMLLAFAFVVRLENTLQAQGITYYEYSVDPIMGLITTVPIDLGSYTATISVDNSGNTVITTPGPAWLLPTNDQPGMVFSNVSGPSYINAASSGAVISTQSYSSPAILNGIDNTSAVEVGRGYQMRVSLTVGGQYVIEYGYYFVNDLTRTFYPITDYDELPENIRDYELPLGTPLWADDATPGVAILPAGFTLPQFATLVPGGPPVPIANQGFIVEGPFYDPANPDIVFIPPIPFGSFDPDVLPPIWVTSGGSMMGTLTINNRTAVDYVRRSGDDRLLIQSLGTAIENHGTLTVNDSRIEAYNVGILHEYSRSVSIDPDDDTNIFYGTGTPASVILNNTQIGRPDGDWEYIIGYDPFTGDPILGTIPGGPGISVNSVGVPEPTRTFIGRGDKMGADGINGRIVAGSDVTMNRYPVGSVMQRSPSTEAQEVIYYLNNIN